MSLGPRPRKIPVPAQAQDSCWLNSPGMQDWRGGGARHQLLEIPDPVLAPENKDGGGCPRVWTES